MVDGVLSASVLQASAAITREAGVPPTPLVSEGLYAETNLSGDPTRAVDALGNTYWRSADIPAEEGGGWLAIDVSSVTPRDNTLFFWRNDAVMASYWDNGTNPFVMNAVDYTIEGSRVSSSEAPGDIVTVLDDTFDGSSVGLASHAPDVGGPWTVHLGTPVVTGSGTVSSATDLWRATVETNETDVTISVPLDGSAGIVSVIFRLTDANNYWEVTYRYLNTVIAIREIIGGVATIRQTSAYDLIGTDIMHVVVSGASVAVDVNGDVPGVHYNSMASGLTATRHGCGGTSGTILSACTIQASGWHTLDTITTNLYSSRQHGPYDLSTYNWVRMNVSLSQGTPGDVAFQVQLHNATQNQDTFLFLGDEIIGEYARVAKIGGTAWSGGNLAQKISTLTDGTHYPLIQNGGTLNRGIEWAATNKIALLNGFSGKYVVIHYGANNAENGLTATDFSTGLDTLVSYAVSVGKTVILPKLFKRTDNAGYNTATQTYNTVIASKVNNTTVFAGPDFYTLVDTGTITLSGDGKHPDTAGYEVIQTTWANWLNDNLYSGEPSAVFSAGSRVFAGSLYAAAMSPESDIPHWYIFAVEVARADAESFEARIRELFPGFISLGAQTMGEAVTMTVMTLLETLRYTPDVQQAVNTVPTAHETFTSFMTHD